MGKWYLHFFSFFYPILLILAGNMDMHTRLDKFEFRSDSTLDGGRSPWASKNQCLHFFFVVIGPIILNLKVTRKCIITCMCSNFVQIVPPTNELKMPHSFIMEKTVSPFVLGSF